MLPDIGGRIGAIQHPKATSIRAATSAACPSEQRAQAVQFPELSQAAIFATAHDSPRQPRKPERLHVRLGIDRVTDHGIEGRVQLPCRSDGSGSRCGR